MIVGIGCDIVEHDLTVALRWESDTNSLQRVFSQSELALYESKKSLKFLCGRFAAKEAVLKCLGGGMYEGISLKEIQILQSEDGKADLVIGGTVKHISDQMGITGWHVSITHSERYSFAFIVAEKQ